MFEDAEHVWLCQGVDGSIVWDKSTKNLDYWMPSVHTDPDLKRTIIHYLQRWRTKSLTTLATMADVVLLLGAQTHSGWTHFFHGWISQDWAGTQQAYYSSIWYRCTGFYWVTCLVTEFWQFA